MCVSELISHLGRSKCNSVHRIQTSLVFQWERTNLVYTGPLSPCTLVAIHIPIGLCTTDISIVRYLLEHNVIKVIFSIIFTYLRSIQQVHPFPHLAGVICLFELQLALHVPPMPRHSSVSTHTSDWGRAYTLGKYLDLIQKVWFKFLYLCLRVCLFISVYMHACGCVYMYCMCLCPCAWP